MILYGVTIVSSAFLLFLVQPIIAKQILPWFGGTAAVWTVCVVFFQAALLAGYAYAHALTRRTPRTQWWLHTTLLVVSVASLPIIASSGWKPTADSDPTWRIAGLLAATIGLPYFLLSSTGPLIQKWFADDAAMATRRARVYRLFALSNIGSLVGLLCYPFVIEPYASLRAQSWGWSIGYGCFVVACASCAWRLRSRTAASSATDTATDANAVSTDATTNANVAPTAARYALWLACAALGSMLLLALTNHITQNIASIPFLWVLPLTLYLLSFVVVFEGRGGRGWYERRWWLPAVTALVIGMTWALSYQRGLLNLYAALPLFSVGLFVACVFCHGELARTKPGPRYLTHFYLSLSAGGAIGGLFVALVAPNLFNNYWETPIALFGVVLVATITSRERNAEGARIRAFVGAFVGIVAATCIFLAGGGTTFAALRSLLPGQDSAAVTAGLVAVAAALLLLATWKRWSVALVVTALACTGYYGMKYYVYLSQDTLHASRNFYGALRVKDSGIDRTRRRDLMHGIILHGAQYRAEDRHDMPSTYYGPTSGIGIALSHLRPTGVPLDVGMIGLGAGTLTAWGRAGDRYRIYELNPAIVGIARRDFTYLADSKATIEVALGDARLSMERELDNGSAADGSAADGSAPDGSARPFDVIAVDAFSSDSIPVHLITREALDVFMRHLKPDGVVAFHVSNRFLRLAPVVAQLATDAQLSAFDVIDEPADPEHVYSDSEWVLVTRNTAFLSNEAVRARTSAIAPIPDLPMWTDQFNNLFKILR